MECESRRQRTQGRYKILTIIKKDVAAKRWRVGSLERKRRRMKTAKKGGPKIGAGMPYVE